MNRAVNTTAGTSTDSFAPGAQSIFRRFIWKEYRMLRGFWLAVAVLGLIAQLVSAQLSFDPRALPGWLFASAWGAAAAYAVGAAVTLFSAEREERTSLFLSQLPVRWQPMFAAKVCIALLSALALAAVLALTRWQIGGAWPSQADVRGALAIGGVAVVEATVWGLFFHCGCGSRCWRL